MSKWREFGTREALDQALAQHLAGRLREDIAQHGAASLAVSGGSTPKGMFAALASCELDWARVVVTLVDERWVAPDSADSNERLVRENLLQQRAAAAQFIGLKSAHGDAAEGIEEVDAWLATIPRPFSAVVLGMGGDGHTASWFPQASNLQQLIDPACPATLGYTDPVTAPHQRITLTLPAVLDCRDLVIHITGEDKRTVLEQAPQAQYPIATVLEQNLTPATIWWAP